MKIVTSREQLNVGDKVVLNERGRKIFYEASSGYFINKLNKSIYFIITGIEKDYLYVNWINHKGFIIHYGWALHKNNVVMYEGSN